MKLRFEVASPMRRASFGLALLCGCSEAILRLPDVEGATTVAVVVEGAPRTIAIAAYGPTAPALSLTVASSDDQLSVRYYGPDVALPYGAFTESPADLWARALPRPIHVESRAWSEEVWRILDPDALDPVLLSIESPVACAERGGCFVDADAWTCTTPCPPPPEVVPPEAPRPPVFAPCPEGWAEDLELRACLAPVSACPVGELQLPADAACHAPGPACAGEWAPALDDATTRFVRAGAAAGDGTRARPFATIDEAGAAAVIALARGAHALPARITGRVVGACAAETHLVGTATVTLAAATLEALSIEAPVLRASGAVHLTGVASRGQLTVESGALQLHDVAAFGAVRVSSGATLIGRDVALAHDGAVLDLARTASATIERAQLTGTVSVNGAALTLRGAALRADQRAALILQDATVTLRQLDVAVTGAEVAVDVRGSSVLDASRLWAAAGAEVVRLGEGSAASFVDASMRAVGGRGSSCVTAVEAKLTFDRVRVSGCAGYGVRIGGPTSEVSLQDLVSAAAAFDLVGRPPIVIRRVEATGFGIVRMAVTGADYPWGLELEDVTLHDGALNLRDEGRARIQRLQILGGDGAGFQTEQRIDTPIVEASDLRIEGRRADMDCSRRECIGAAILARGGMTVDRFYFADNTGAGMDAQHADRPSRLRNGVIADQETGIALFGAPTELRALLEGVTLRNVKRVCDPCGEGAP